MGLFLQVMGVIFCILLITLLLVTLIAMVADDSWVDEEMEDVWREDELR